MKTALTTFIGVFLTLVVLSPSLAFAQSNNSGYQGVIGGDDTNYGLVTCSGIDCDACDLVRMVNRIVNFLITILSLLATIMFVIAGFRLVTAGGDTGAVQSAKRMFQAILIGFIIVLSAWLLVDLLLKTLLGTDQGLQPLTTIQCGGIINTSKTDTQTGLQVGN